MTAKDSPSRETLRREISLPNLFAFSLGTIIGVGWITMLGSWLADAGSLGAIIAFVGGGLVIALIGTCYAEAATMYPVAGGEVAYGYAMWGSKTAFVVGWLLAFAYISATSFLAISVGWVISAILPGIEGPPLYAVFGGNIHLGELVLGLLLMLFITTLNYRGVKQTARLQDSVTFALLLITLLFVSAGIYWGESANMEPLFISDMPKAGALGVLAVLATTPFWYGGFDTIPQAMGELKNRANLAYIPHVTVAAILTAMLFYVAIILVTSMALPREQLLTVNLPAATVFRTAFDSIVMEKLVLGASLCGLLSSLNALFYSATRLIFALGRGHMIPHKLAAVHPRTGTPFMAVVFVGLVGTIGALFGKSAIGLIAASSAICFAGVYIPILLGLAKLRNTQPDHPRPFKMPGGKPVFYLSALLGVLIFGIALYEPFAANNYRALPTEWGVLLFWLLLGGIFWLASARVRATVDEKSRAFLVLGEKNIS